MQRKSLWVLAITIILTTHLIAQMTVKDADTNVLMQVNDEGTIGSITLLSGAAPSSPAAKLYNQGGNLYWNGSAVATGGVVTEINDLTDGKTRGFSVYLGSASGSSDMAMENCRISRPSISRSSE